MSCLLENFTARFYAAFHFSVNSQLCLLLTLEPFADSSIIETSV